MLEYFGTATDYYGIPTEGGEHLPLNITYRADLEDVPESLRGAYRTASAVTINHSRIEFFEDRFPDPRTLRHELVHLAWRQLTRNRYTRWGQKIEGGGPAGALIDEAVGQARQIGTAFLDFAKKARRRETPPPPAGMGEYEWYKVYQAGRSAGSWLRRLQQFKKQGELDGHRLKGSLEISLMVPDDGLVTLAKHLGYELPDAQNATIALYHGYAQALDVPLAGDYAEEEPVAYRAGADKDFADRLFASLLEKKAEDTAFDVAFDAWLGDALSFDASLRAHGLTSADGRLFQGGIDGAQVDVTLDGHAWRAYHADHGSTAGTGVSVMRHQLAAWRRGMPRPPSDDAEFQESQVKRDPEGPRVAQGPRCYAPRQQVTEIARK